MARKKFLRGKWRTYSKLGNRRKNKQKYRKAKGRDTKVREKKKGNPKRVEVGYKKQKKISEIKRVHNLQDLLILNKGEKIILGRLGQKKKLKIIEKAKEKNIKIINLKVEDLMAKIERENKKKKEKIKGDKKNTEKKDKEREKETKGDKEK